VDTDGDLAIAQWFSFIRATDRLVSLVCLDRLVEQDSRVDRTSVMLKPPA
jgi:hypothetical protein